MTDSGGGSSNSSASGSEEEFVCLKPATHVCLAFSQGTVLISAIATAGHAVYERSTTTEIQRQ